MYPVSIQATSTHPLTKAQKAGFQRLDTTCRGKTSCQSTSTCACEWNQTGLDYPFATCLAGLCRTAVGISAQRYGRKRTYKVTVPHVGWERAALSHLFVVSVLLLKLSGSSPPRLSVPSEGRSSLFFLLSVGSSCALISDQQCFDSIFRRPDLSCYCILPIAERLYLVEHF